MIGPMDFSDGTLWRQEGSLLTFDLTNTSLYDQILATNRGDVLFEGGTVKINLMHGSAVGLNDIFDLILLDETSMLPSIDDFQVDYTSAELPQDDPVWVLSPQALPNGYTDL
ncbi:MAG: hypothetical protein Q4D38_03280 [Planctomycetia bacterium]|nr:hypothetical protein [Planctomycetia bacterium]